MTRFSKLPLIVLALAMSSATFGQVSQNAAEEYNGTPSRSARAKTTGRIIVKWRAQARSLSANARAQKASAATGLKLQASSSSGDFQALVSDGPRTLEQLQEATAQLERSADVELAAPEYRRKAHALSDDPLLTEQWYLLSAQPAATRTEFAWDTTQGNSAIIVAVLDTGVRPDHPDLQGKLLDGYDFVSDPDVGNDGDGRDGDESDPGDWVSPQDVQQRGQVFDEDCLTDDGEQANSSWHGTRVAGLIGAQTNNAVGIAGNAWNTRVLPIRVLGKCGGSDLDIMDAMRWAAGIPVGGLVNPTPAHIINLSLGGEGACTSLYQAVLDEVTARGVLVVASAGNEGTQVSAPANCNGVLGVGGLRHLGTKVGFSNLGPQVGISAPGGNCVNTAGACLYSIVVATNSGATTPGANTYTNALNFNVGTSFSAPMVASAAALVKAANGALTPAEMILVLKGTAGSFPVNPAVATCTIPTASGAPQDSECNCTIDTCGAGMLDTGTAAAAAAALALIPIAVVEATGPLTVGSTLTINGSKSLASPGRTIAGYQWSIHDVTGTPPTLANAALATTTLVLAGDARFTLRLTVTDDLGAQDARDVVLATSAPAPAPPPAPTPTPSPNITPSGGGGGGGQLGWELLALALLGWRTRVRSRELA